jgi:hypothetical protein
MKLSLITLILVFLSSFTAFAQIAKKDCQENIDYSSRFPPVRDQDGHGLCWSFAASALFEEALCLDSKRDRSLKYECGQKISVLDMARCNFALGSGFSEGGLTEGALECVLSKNAKYLNLKRIDDKRANKEYEAKEHRPGVCIEENAPFHNLRGGINGLYDDYFRGVVDPNSLNDYLVKLYQQCTDQTKLEGAVAILKKMLPKQETYGVDFKKALTSGLKDEEFLREILITPNCVKQRLDLSHKYQVKTENFSAYEIVSDNIINGKRTITRTKMPEATLDKKFSSIKQSLKSGTSIEAGICYNRYNYEKKNTFLSSLFAKPDGPVSKNDCGGHAIVLAGLRWNESKNQCETFVRNSWGSSASLNGWVKIDNVLEVTFNTSQLVKK